MIDTGLLDWVIKLFDIIYQEGEREWLNEANYKEALNELYIKLESGEISEDEYELAEEIIIERLKEVREYKREHGYME